jgi:hypothetical protein
MGDPKRGGEDKRTMMHYGERLRGTDLDGSVFIVPQTKQYQENFDKIKWRGDEDESDGDAD